MTIEEKAELAARIERCLKWQKHWDELNCPAQSKWWGRRVAMHRKALRQSTNVGINK